MRIHDRIHEPWRLSRRARRGRAPSAAPAAARLPRESGTAARGAARAERHPARVDRDRDRQRERADHGSSHQRYDGSASRRRAPSRRRAACAARGGAAPRPTSSRRPRGAGSSTAARDPVSAASTNCVWNSMRIGASSAEDEDLHQHAERDARRAAESIGALRVRTRMAPRIFGRNSSRAVASTKPEGGSRRSHSGQSGKSWRGCDEILRADHGRARTTNAVDSTRDRNHSGADTYAMTPVMNTARCAGCSPSTGTGGS